MDKILQMYELIGEMIQAAEKRDRKKVFELDSVYDTLAEEAFSGPLADNRPKFDYCKQYCDWAVSQGYEEYHDGFVSHARENHAKLPSFSDKKDLCLRL